MLICEKNFYLCVHFCTVDWKKMAFFAPSHHLMFKSYNTLPQNLCRLYTLNIHGSLRLSDSPGFPSPPRKLPATFKLFAEISNSFLLRNRSLPCYNFSMNTKVTYYVSRKNWLLWIAAALMLCSIFARIAYFCEKGADPTTLWLQIVLPVLATVLYLLRVLLDGREHFYKTAAPVFLLALYLGIHALGLSLRFRFVLLYWVVLFGVFLLYREVTCGRFPRLYFSLCLVLAGACAFFVYDVRAAFFQYNSSLLRTVAQLHDSLVLTGILLTVLCAREHNDGRYHPTWGDRKDGRRIRNLNPISRVANYIMPNRNGASNSIRDRVEITNIERYIRAKRKEGYAGFGITEVFLSAYVRCVARYPGCNRFLSGQTVYTRDEDIQFCMVIKKEMTIDAPDTIIKLHLSPRDTSKEVYEKFHAAVEEVHNTPLNSTFDNVARYINYIPGVFLKFTVWLLKALDYFGLLPKFLLEVSPFHCSVFFTSMASLGIPAVIHHLYDFGNTPAFCAFGAKYREQELTPEGEILPRKYIDYAFNLDERTVDGYYYAEVLKYLRRLLRNPECLDTPPETVNRDID